MDFLNIPLLAASALVFLCVLSGMLSVRFGFSFLLVFLLAGALAGEDGPGGLRFDDFSLSFIVGNVALAVILLDGGLRTSFSLFRAGLKPSLVLATVGVAVTAGVTGGAAWLLLDLGWPQAILLGSIVGSTDAAAVFAMLKKSGVRLNERVATTLEIESGMNDPMAVYLTLAFAGFAVDAANGVQPDIAASLRAFVLQFGLGALAGIASGYAFAALLRRLPRTDAGILALLVVSAGLVVFASTGLVGGSGFLAAYLLGMILANRSGRRIDKVLPAMDGYAWLAQAGMFLLLGLLVTPSQLVTVAGPALGVAAVLMLVARPLAVWLCLAPFHFRPKEIWFISWVGLRGAVPIVLALFPLMAGVADAMLLFNVAFVVVVASLLMQGSTIALFARRLDVALPDLSDERRARAVFGDFVLDATVPVGTLCDVYGLPKPTDEALALGPWIASRLGRTPIVGDEVAIGAATLVIRAMEGPHIQLVGLKLPSDGSDGVE